MSDWLPKEEWLAQQQKKDKPHEKPPFHVPSDVKKILNPALDKGEIENFLTCICYGVKDLFRQPADRMVKLRCMNCGMEYGYPDDDVHFNISRKKPEQQVIPTQVSCMCSKCSTGISGQQAKTSSEFVGRALCQACLGAELA